MHTFTGEFYKMFKEKLTKIIHNLSWNKGMKTSQLILGNKYQTNTQIRQSANKKNQTTFYHEYRHTNSRI